MKKRCSEEQIIGFLRDGEAGIAVKDPCRKHGFSEATISCGNRTGGIRLGYRNVGLERVGSSLQRTFAS